MLMSHIKFTVAAALALALSGPAFAQTTDACVKSAAQLAAGYGGHTGGAVQNRVVQQAAGDNAGRPQLAAGDNAGRPQFAAGDNAGRPQLAAGDNAGRPQLAAGGTPCL
jgi:hypothetical protein